MTVFLRRLVEYAWVFYAACAMGILIYVVRALVAHRERGVAVFTLEREAANSRAAQAWVMVFIFSLIGVAVFASTNFILPKAPAYNSGTPLPTATPRAGVMPLTPGLTPTATDILVPTLPPLTSTVPPSPTLTTVITNQVPTEQAPTETPTPTPTSEATPTVALETAASGEMTTRFGDFAVLAGYNLPSTQVTTADSLLLTLYWRATDNPATVDYMVFTHLLSDEARLIAQHDGIPANGARPTSGWGAGETIVDPHQMTFKSDALDYTGTASIVVGLYDPDAPDERLPTGAGNDYVTLPVTIEVTGQGG